MSATKSLSARTPERHVTLQQQNRVRLEELESRMLLSRAAFSIEPVTAVGSSEPPPDESATTAIVARETTESTSTTPADSTTESDQGITQTRDAATRRPSHSDALESESSSVSDTGEAHSFPTSDSPTQESSATPTRKVVATRSSEPNPTPVRPVRPEPMSDVEKTDEPATQRAEPAAENVPEKADTDTSSNDAEAVETSDESPNCITRETARTANTKCSTQQLALTAQPSDGSEDTQEAATTDRSGAETIVEQATAPESPVIESPQAATAPQRSEPSNAEAAADQLSDLAIPESLLADVLTDALADEQPVGESSELGQTVFAAGAFAVVFSKPLSRLAGAERSALGDASGSGTVPILYTRKRRKDSRNSPAGTKDKPDDPDDDRQPSRGRGPAREATKLDGHIHSEVAEQYESLEAALQATLHSWRDSSDDSTHAGGMFHSAKSFAAGALAAATALLTLQGSRRAERARPQLRPAAPTYHGQTAVAAN